MNEYLAAWKQYAVFSGRATRKQFWLFTLVNAIVAIVLSYVGTNVEFLLWLTPIYGLAAFLPSLGVTIRRLHDTGKSGWWLLIGLVPIIGSIVLIVFYATDSQPGSNKYGPNPKGAPAPTA